MCATSGDRVDEHRVSGHRVSGHRISGQRAIGRYCGVDIAQLLVRSAESGRGALLLSKDSE